MWPDEQMLNSIEIMKGQNEDETDRTQLVPQKDQSRKQMNKRKLEREGNEKRKVQKLSDSQDVKASNSDVCSEVLRENLKCVNAPAALGASIRRRSAPGRLVNASKLETFVEDEGLKNDSEFSVEGESNCIFEVFPVFPLYYMLRGRAADMRPDPDYLAKLASFDGISGSGRTRLLQWLDYVHRKVPGEPLSPHTLHLSVNLFDRFMSIISARADEKTKVKVASKLEVICAACFHLASKMEDIRAISTLEICEMSSQCFSFDDVLLWERRILAALQCKVYCPTVLDFLHELLSSCGTVFDSAKQEDTTANSTDDTTANSTTAVADQLENHQPAPPDGEGCSGKSSCSPTAQTAALFGVLDPLMMENCCYYLSEVVLMHSESLRVPYHLIACASIVIVMAYMEMKPRHPMILPEAIQSFIVSEMEGLCEAIEIAARIFHSHSKQAESEELRDALFVSDTESRHATTARVFREHYCRWVDRFSTTNSATPKTKRISKRNSTSNSSSRQDHHHQPVKCEKNHHHSSNQSNPEQPSSMGGVSEDGDDEADDTTLRRCSSETPNCESLHEAATTTVQHYKSSNNTQDETLTCCETGGGCWSEATSNNTCGCCCKESRTTITRLSTSTYIPSSAGTNDEDSLAEEEDQSSSSPEDDDVSKEQQQWMNNTVHHHHPTLPARRSLAG